MTSAAPASHERLRLALAALFGSGALVLYLLAATVPFSMRNVTVSRNGGARVASGLPWTAPGPGAFVLSGTVVRYPSTRGTVRVTPDDRRVRILVGGDQKTPVSTGAVHGVSKTGVDLDLTPMLAAGTNAVEFHIASARGPGEGISIQPNPGGIGPLGVALAILAVISAAASLGLLLAATALPAPVRVLVCASLAVQLVYFSSTGPFERTSDIAGHLAYIDLVRTERSLPSPLRCWECYQPPAYYLLAAAVEEVTDLPRFVDSRRVLQLLSVVFGVVFVVYAARTLTLFLAPALPLWTLTAFVAFFPSQLLHAPRIGNDPLVYALSSVAFFHICRWWKARRERTDRDYLTALAVGALALNVKLNAIVMLALQGFLHAWSIATMLGRSAVGSRPAHWWRREAGRVALALGIVTLGLALACSRSLLDRMDGRNTPLLVGNWRGIGEQQRVGNQLSNFLGFDLGLYLENPYANVYEDSSGRQQYLPYLARTALFGEFQVRGDFALAIARTLAAMFLGVLAWSVAGLAWSLARGRIDALLPASAGFLLFVAASVQFRWSLPYAACNHWRFIVPIIVPMAVLMGGWWQALRSTPRWGHALDHFFAIFVLLFSLLSVTYWSLPVLELFMD